MILKFHIILYTMKQTYRLGILLQLLFCVCFTNNAYAADNIIIEGTVYDRATDTQLFGANVKLLNASDSTICVEAIADGERETGVGKESVRMSMFTISDIARSGKYILKITHADYQSLYLDIDPASLSKRANKMELGKLYLKRKTKTLNEVVVKASKVMFYNKGDTIIYNADAFVLAEGSMLDALIRQMPGVELKENGQIFVNGRFVENLLLNGKDFFKGNRQMMLDNLGAYTVKDIAVYERQDEMDRIMGADYGRKQLSMDVRLKKEYNQGLLANAEAGYGSSDRYLGRLFGLWYSDNVRLSLYGNANNLSDNRKPGEYTEFTPGSMQSGDFKTYQGGFDYMAKIPYKDVSFAGDVILSHQTVDDDKSVLTTNFLPDGYTYGYSYNQSRNKSLSLTTSHSLEVIRQKWNLKAAPNFKYHKNNDLSNLSSAVFSKEWEDMGKDFIDNLYSGASSDVLRSILNRNKDDNKRIGHTIDADLTVNGKIKLPNEADAMTYLASGSYRRRHFDQFQRYILNFGNNPEPTDYYDRYFDNSPNYRWTTAGALGYVWAIKSGMYLDSWYQYDHVYSHEVSELYRLENIYDTDSEYRPLGYLPSKTEYDSTLDPNNSFNSTKTENRHALNFSWTWLPSSITYIYCKVPILYRNQHLRYIRGEVNTSFSRNRFFVGNASFGINYFGRPHFIYAEYDRKVSSPDLVDMVEFKNDLDPLNVRLGNPGLKDSETHMLRLSYRYDAESISQSYRINGTLYRNSLAYGYNYDSATGIKTGRMYNINGNYELGLFQSLFIRLGSSKQFTFGNTTTANYRQSVDLVSENSVTPQKNKVESPSVSETLEFTFRFGENKISMKGEGRISRYESKLTNFRNFTAQDYNCGLKGNFKLPAGFGINTDFTIYTRRGYSEDTLNKTNFVWNVQASYTTLKGQLTFMVDGFDILHNLSNVFYSVNAQARTETYTNVLPRYVMFHVQWKFHKAPKKKQY